LPKGSLRFINLYRRLTDVFSPGYSVTIADVNYASVFKETKDESPFAKSDHTTTSYYDQYIDPVLRQVPEENLAVGTAYLTNHEFRREVLLHLSESMNGIAEETLSGRSETVDFFIVSYSFGTIIMADLLTLYNRSSGKLELVEEYKFSAKALVLLDSLRIVFSIGCPYSWV
jgi:hypothetical protein